MSPNRRQARPTGQGSKAPTTCLTRRKAGRTRKAHGPVFLRVEEPPGRSRFGLIDSNPRRRYQVTALNVSNQRERVDAMSQRDLPPDGPGSTTQRARSGDDGIVPLDREPWVQLADGKALANWSAADEIRYNQQNRQSEKLRFFRQVFDFLKENEIAGDYHEYGCHRVRTFRMALTEARRKNFRDMMFWAFDSFAGLPEPVTETSVRKWKQGALATSEQDFLKLISAHGIYTSQVCMVKGLYADSLTADLQRRFVD